MCHGWFFIIMIISFSLAYNFVRFFELTIVVSKKIAISFIPKFLSITKEVDGAYPNIPYAEQKGPIDQEESTNIYNFEYSTMFYVFMYLLHHSNACIAVDLALTLL